ncbi:MAG: flagellar basal-body rod protein FlgG [Cyanobacteria bacterium]|nr:flagellar basal-body rod protein FlgG [Cyanobacteriota bacterium]
MLRALSTAATGATTQQLNIDIIANNVANVNTTGYKKVRGEFQDLLNQTLSSAGTIGDQGTIDPTGIQIGLGVLMSATQRVFLPGSIQQTGNPYDLALQGDGYFQVQLDNGETAYTRDGSFKRDANGGLVSSDGYPVQPAITIPADAIEIIISQNGTVSARQAGSADFNQVGQLQLARFPNPAGLDSIGKNLFTANPAAGTPTQGNAGQADFGRTTINQGYLEGSNVQIVEELIGLITAQRSFEANSKVIKAGDELLQTVNNII